jgi:hypothetical protein
VAQCERSADEEKMREFHTRGAENPFERVEDGGTIIPITVFGENDPGAPGKLRVSHRELDPERSKDNLLVRTHTSDQWLQQGEIVSVDIEIWPSSRIWHKGETLRVNVAPRLVRDTTWFLPLVYDTRNEGRHIIHTGGRYGSYLLVPVVPPKYQHKQYAYR